MEMTCGGWQSEEAATPSSKGPHSRQPLLGLRDGRPHLAPTVLPSNCSRCSLSFLQVEFTPHLSPGSPNSAGSLCHRGPYFSISASRYALGLMGSKPLVKRPALPGQKAFGGRWNWATWGLFHVFPEQGRIIGRPPSYKPQMGHISRGE